ncbi:MAG: hypothetical protein FJ279_21810 [Planctomycetes bacterium]|nr:hypothetical protein [Planctomycetota bacterium]
MIVTYKGQVKGHMVELPAEAEVPDGAEVIVVLADEKEKLEDLAWAALAAETWAEDWSSAEDQVYDNWRQRYGVSKKKPAR